MSAFVPEVQAQAKAASFLLFQRIRDYFKDEGHRVAFEVWYREKYGKDYLWREVTK